MYNLNKSNIGILFEKVEDIFSTEVSLLEDKIQFHFEIKRVQNELGNLISQLKLFTNQTDIQIEENYLSDKYYYGNGIFTLEDLENNYWDLSAKDFEILTSINKNVAETTNFIPRKRSSKKIEIATKLLSENEVAKLFICMQNLKFVTSTNATKNAEALQILIGFNVENMRKNLGSHYHSNAEKQNILDFLKQLSEKVNKMPLK